jgi:hypothetical protein
MAEAASKMRGSADAATRYKAQLEAAGFVNVKEIIYKWPSNRWPKHRYFKELGEFSPKTLVVLQNTVANHMICKGCGRSRMSNLLWKV